MTTQPLLILDRQHAGKRHHPTDMGAQADIDQDGQVEAWEREADLTPVYGVACADLVRARGVECQIIDPAGAGRRADYSERHAQAREIASHRRGPIAYAAMHLNAGGGSYGLVGYDPRSQSGRQLAEAIGAGLESIPVLSGVHVVALERQWSRGIGTIRGIYSGPTNICGVLLEPLFLDCPEHQAYIVDGGLAAVGQAIGRGVLDYFEQANA